MNDGYIYIRDHESYNKYNAYKLGKSYNMFDRESTYITGEIRKSIFLEIYKVKDPDNVERILKNEFNDIKVYVDGGTEFFKTDIIHMIKDTMKNNNILYEKVDIKDTPPPTKTHSPPISPPISPPKSPENIVEDNIIDNDIVYNERQYQMDIIEKGLEILLTYFKFYLELATGGGKSYIVFSILNKILPDTIFYSSFRLDQYQRLRPSSDLHHHTLTQYLYLLQNLFL